MGRASYRKYRYAGTLYDPAIYCTKQLPKLPSSAMSSAQSAFLATLPLFARRSVLNALPVRSTRHGKLYGETCKCIFDGGYKGRDSDRREKGLYPALDPHDSGSGFEEVALLLCYRHVLAGAWQGQGDGSRSQL